MLVGQSEARNLSVWAYRAVGYRKKRTSLKCKQRKWWRYSI